MRDEEYVQVLVLATDPGSEYPERPPAGVWWPAGVPMPVPGDRIKIGESGSVLSGETVEIQERTWVYGMLLGYGRAYAKPARPGVILELRGEVVRRAR